ncbi:MAG: DUF4783 domain-containing protein [Saprospiraceae bacterium]|nr:DUF4783 domain-containing protein [Saprospiraceae bacterium]MCB9326994.1 DUF4783 domain-containing protein [Lewinellaceae bacterium]
MKKSFVFVLFLAPVIGLLSFDLAAITRAINDGDADALGQYFGPKVEISIADDGNEYSKPAAIEAVRKFFGKNRPLSFVQVHQGTSKGSAAHYCIGNMETKDATFRVYIYLEKVAEDFKIKELRFDKE